MPNVRLTEGGLVFEFNNVDVAQKYDDWRHYRNVFQIAGGTAKAVDFIVCKDSQLWLIEVKDYRMHARTKALDLADEVALKVKDTLSGLVSAKFQAADKEEEKASASALKCKKLRVALHLEQPVKPSKLFPQSIDPADIKMKLRQKLRFADCHPMVFDNSTFPAELGSARTLPLA
jgi:hypothetical protein